MHRRAAKRNKQLGWELARKEGWLIPGTRQTGTKAQRRLLVNLTEGTSCALQIKVFQVGGLGEELPYPGQCPEVYA